MYCSAKKGFAIILQGLKNTASRTKKEYSSKLEVHPFKFHNLDGGPETSTKLTKEEAEKYYYQMQTIRTLENAAASLYRAKIIRGFCHLYSGQEGCCVGMKAAMRDNDNIITSYRAHGWAYLMGISPAAVLAELTGRVTGCVRGKGGSMHMYSPRFYGGNGIVGAQVPLGAGIALACKYRKNGGTCLALYGDGAANQGQVFESFNMAFLWKLPVIFVCENNKYGMGTSAQRAASNINYYCRGDVIPGIWVDGMDILAVRCATEFAIGYVQENGPIIMEMSTYRYSGHSMSDPGVSYRSREEVQAVRDKQDPIVQFKNKCTKLGLLEEKDIAKTNAKIKEDIDKAAEKSKQDKEIGLDELTYDIYSKNYEPSIRGALGQHLKHELKGKPVNL